MVCGACDTVFSELDALDDHIAEQHVDDNAADGQVCLADHCAWLGW